MFAPKPASVVRLSRSGSQRCFATAAQVVFQNEGVEFVPRTTPYEVKSTTLENGSKVVSIQSDTASSGVALFIPAGSRYETREETGVSQFAKHMVFQRTQTKSPIFVVRDVETLVGRYSSAISRDSFILSARVEPTNFSALRDSWLDSLQPQFHEYIIRDLYPTIELESQAAEQDPNTIFTELLHATAFRHVGLGRGLYCPSSRVGSIGPQLVEGFWKRRVVGAVPHTWVGVGVNHEQLVESAQKRAKASSEQSSPSTYYGGDATVSLDINTRVGIVFKGASENDKDLPALAVLSAITGGDTRYSHDGPGRGVTSRLYKNVLKKLDAVQATATLNASYSDAGLWGVYAEALPGNATRVVELLASELASIKKEGVNPKEFEAARNRAKAAFLRELDCPSALVQYLGRKASASGALLTPTDFVSRLDKLTAEDVSKVAKTVLSSPVTLVGLGDVAGLPLARDVQSKLN